MPAQITHISGIKRVNMTRMILVSVLRSSSPMLTLIISRETASMPAGTAQKIRRTLSEEAKAEMPTLPTKAAISQFTISPRRV